MRVSAREKTVDRRLLKEKTMGPINERDTPGICRSCGSDQVSCTSEYYTTGGDMEHVEFKHHCGKCGHGESEIQQGCYGYDNTYNCSLPHK
jgi:hypothetical protein